MSLFDTPDISDIMISEKEKEERKKWTKEDWDKYYDSICMQGVLY